MAISMTGPTTRVAEATLSEGVAVSSRDSGGDSALARKAAEGDVYAFRTLVERYQRPMAALVSRMVHGGTSSDVDDIVQELFLRAWKGLPRFRGDAQFSTWLYRIAVNTTIKHRSRSRAESSQVVAAEDTYGGLDQLAAGESTDPEALLQRQDRETRLRAAVAQLPEKHRTVIVLHYFEGRSCEEIAEIVGCSVGTVWSRLHYGCKRLRTVLGEPL